MITELNTGGAEKNLVRLACAAAEEGMEVEVHALFGEGPLCRQLRDAGIAYRVWGIRGMGQVYRLLELCRTLRRTRPHILHTFLYHANLLGRICRVFLPSTRLIVSHRGYESRFSWWLHLEAATAAAADLHLVVNHEMEDFWNRYAAGRVVYLPNGLTAEELHDPALRPRIPQGIPLRMLGVGRLISSKDWSTLLAALHRLRVKGIEWECRLVGEGEESWGILRLIERFRLGDRITIFPFSRNLAEHFAWADLFVSSSLLEGCPNALLEGMGWGLPAVATDIGGHRDLVAPGETGFTFRPRDAAELAYLLELMAFSPGLRLRLGQNSFQRVREEFSFDRQWEICRRVYRRLMGYS